MREWRHDWYARYPDAVEDDPQEPAYGELRALLASGWLGGSADCRSAVRNNNQPENAHDNNGFRMCVDISAASTPRGEAIP